MGSDAIELDTTEEEWIAKLEKAIYPDRQNLYDGPNAITAKEMERRWKGGRSTHVRNVRELVEQGKMVEVRVMRKVGKRDLVLNAWVPMDDYREWEEQKRRKEAPEVGDTQKLYGR